MRYSLKATEQNEDGKLDFVAKKRRSRRRWKGKKEKRKKVGRRKSKAIEGEKKDAFPILNSTEYGIHRLIPLLSTVGNRVHHPSLMKLPLKPREINREKIRVSYDIATSFRVIIRYHRCFLLPGGGMRGERERERVEWFLTKVSGRNKEGDF